ncbi:hypothetical protein TNCV_636611 [Trichonephila clavipes]|nr:hypothetical protein TNCV_636611 [Trichonephila clavipes]
MKDTQRRTPNKLGDEATQKQVGVEVARMEEESGRNQSPKENMEGGGGDTGMKREWRLQDGTCSRNNCGIEAGASFNH